MQTDDVIIVDYDLNWPMQFRQEADFLRSVFGEENILAIEHIGSTAVPGLAAKPIIDILVFARSLETIVCTVPAMEALGYEFCGPFGISGRLYFRKGFPRTHHVHVYEPGHANATANLKFRDYLYTHPKTAAIYADLKRDLAARYRHDRNAYTDAKTNFVLSVLKNARQEVSYAEKP